MLLLTYVAQAKAALRPDVIAYWIRLHNCEQPSSWHGGYPRYPGGLGISVGGWQWWAGELGLLRQYPDGGSAPPIVQMRVADWGWRQHRGSWGCMRTIGYPP